MLEQFFLGIAEFIIGGVVTAIISALVLGFMAKFVIQRVLGNKDVKEVIKLLKEIKDALKEKKNGN